MLHGIAAGICNLPGRGVSPPVRCLESAVPENLRSWMPPSCRAIIASLWQDAVLRNDLCVSRTARVPRNLRAMLFLDKSSVSLAGRFRIGAEGYGMNVDVAERSGSA